MTNGSGTIAGANVTNVSVTCTTTTYTVGGTLSGLSSGTVVLQDNGGNNLSLTANGPFTFSAPLNAGASYNVTVVTQPAGETCVVTSGSGTVNANVTSVQVTCTAKTYTIGGTLSGLTGGDVVLQDNGGNDLVLNANGTFTFSQPVANGAPYAVTVLTQPVGQHCTVTSGAGTVAASNVTNVSVTCVKAYTIGGALTGLLPMKSVVLQDNGGDNLTLSANGGFTFATALPTGATYAVTVLTQPAGQTCTVTNGTGTVGMTNVVNVAVTCK
ncbi:MAG: hypothetical protein NVS3B10_26380 [Polyangiales bacterium]